MFKTSATHGPRKVAETHNDEGLFADEPALTRDGLPAGPGVADIAAQPKVASIRNPPDPPAPCKGLRRDK
jgi:hypothetical protein